MPKDKLRTHFEICEKVIQIIKKESKAKIKKSATLKF